MSEAGIRTSGPGIRGNRTGLPLSEADSATLLAGYGVPFAPWGVAQDREEAAKVAGSIGYPVAVKVLVPGLAHKSDIGGVELDLRTPRELEEAVGRIEARVSDAAPGGRTGFLVQRMAGAGLEMIAGAVRDPQFGPVVMIGLGGVYAELFDDVAFVLAPVFEANVMRGLGELRSAALLGEVRGRRRRDVRALVAVAQSLGRVLLERPDVLSIDVNPLVVLAEGEGCLAVDALVEVSDRVEEPPARCPETAPERPSEST
ncbi:MAG: acetyl-CoA synthetase [Bacillota bacterium]|nr:MAG: acetyl-CoA synthetase [Bacillota bacterium]